MVTRGLPTLWHYTCTHSQERIGRTSALRPGKDGYVWLTDLDYPFADALGLTSKILDCDRTAHRYRVRSLGDARPWVEERRFADPVRVRALESVPGVLILHWWVATSLVPVIYDPMIRRYS